MMLKAALRCSAFPEFHLLFTVELDVTEDFFYHTQTLIAAVQNKCTPSGHREHLLSPELCKNLILVALQ